MQIDDIKPLPSDPNMRRLRVGRKTVATLRASDVDALAIEVGTPWTDALAEKIQAAVAAQAARRDAMRMLGKRALSRREVILRLTKKGHAKAVAARIADELAADRWIDDRAYGQALAEEITRKKPAAIRLVAAKLRARRIDDDIVEEIAQQAAAGANETESAMRLAKTRLRTMKGLSAVATRRRIAGTLARRGFDEETVNAVLQQLKLADFGEE